MWIIKNNNFLNKDDCYYNHNLYVDHSSCKHQSLLYVCSPPPPPQTSTHFHLWQYLLNEIWQPPPPPPPHWISSTWMKYTSWKVPNASEQCVTLSHRFTCLSPLPCPPFQQQTSEAQGKRDVKITQREKPLVRSRHAGKGSYRQHVASTSVPTTVLCHHNHGPGESCVQSEAL